MKVLKSHKCFDGLTQFWEHDSKQTQTKMKFSTFTPPGQIQGCLIWLSGLTCTEENFITKAGAQKYLAQENMMVICPDTSPRGLNLAHEHESYDFGSGAGFYVDALTPGYRDHYRMYSYVAHELTDLLGKHFKVTRLAISGHSMGGHGALVIGLREQDMFTSISAFSPIVHPMQAPWGQKAFNGYLGPEHKSEWQRYDACELVRAGHTCKTTLFVDQGGADEFLKEQLLTPHLVEACEQSSQKLEVHYREGYDHSYYFISSYIGQHILFHAQALKNA